MYGTIRHAAALLCFAAVALLFGATSALAASPPAVEDESVTNVSSTSATLKATINPEEAAMTYRFEYGTTTSYGASAPIKEVEIAPGATGFEVETHIQGLSPLTTYHFRVVASNSEGVEHGSDMTFKTEGLGGPLTLLDGRQWEMVTPPNKHGALIEAGRDEGGAIQAAADGSGIVYYASAPVTGEEEGSRSPEATSVLSRREPAGWSTEDLSVRHDEPNNVKVGNGTEYKDFSTELSLGVFVPHDFMKLTPETTEWTPYLRDAATKALVPLVTAGNVPPGTEFSAKTRSGGSENLLFEGASPDLSHIVLSSEVPLTEGASGYGMYEWVSGRLQLVSILPGAGETQATGESYLGDSQFGRGRDIHAVSDDGSRIVFHGGNHLYLRDIALRQTLQLDTGGTQDPRFWAATPDGTKVIFTDASVLAPGAVEGRSNLYQCSVEMVAGNLACELTDLAPGFSVSGVIGASEDGSYVYFGTEGGDFYLAHAGSVSAVAANIAFSASYFGDFGELTARVSPNGRYLAFVSTTSLTGYDNRDAASGLPDTEVYLYDATSGSLACISCNPTGARPSGFKVEFGKKTLVNARGTYGSNAWLSGTLPGWITTSTGGEALHQPRYLSDSGRVFFNSTEALVPQDVNGLEDVYEYEPKGVGTCATAGGCVNLISSGESQEESVFMDASESGADAFFVTSKPLVEADQDHAIDMYDAHACSAEAPCIRQPASSPPCESSDGCKGAPSAQPAVFGPPASATFSGEGNLWSAKPKHRVRKSDDAKRKLRRALKKCAIEHRHSRHERSRCERRARRKWRHHHGGKGAAHHRKSKAIRRGSGR